MKYYRLTSGYAKTIRSHYYYAAEDDIKPKELIKWFEKSFPWLKVWKIDEVTKNEVRYLWGYLKHRDKNP